jgi:uncharacterized membrane protein
MKLATRIAAVLALLAFATPVLACGDQTKTAASTEKKPAVAKAEKKAAAKAEKSAKD